jgi:hypothetical protein
VSGAWSVQPGSLIRASTDWRDRADVLEGTAKRLRLADQSGFPPSVEGAAAAFVREWATMVDDLAETARDFEDRMMEAHGAYVESDVRSQESFQEWLLRMGGGER